jgi:hypothetical protein
MREIRDGDCDVLASALALLVAMSLKPPPPTPPDPPLPSLPSPPAPESDEPLPPVPGLAAGPFPPSEPGSSEYDDPRPSVPRPHGWRIDVSGEGTLSTGAIPSVDPGFAAYLELLDEKPSLFAPSIRLGAEVGENQMNDIRNSVVSRIVGRLDACSFRGMLSQPWSDQAFTLEPCLRIDVGRLGVQSWPVSSTPTPDGSPVLTQVETSRLWVAPAGLVRLRWTTPGIFVEIEGGVTVPLTREHFSGYALDFTVPPIGATTGVGFGIYVLDTEPARTSKARTQAGR